MRFSFIFLHKNPTYFFNSIIRPLFGSTFSTNIFRYSLLLTTIDVKAIVLSFLLIAYIQIHFICQSNNFVIKLFDFSWWWGYGSYILRFNSFALQLHRNIYHPSIHWTSQFKLFLFIAQSFLNKNLLWRIWKNYTVMWDNNFLNFQQNNKFELYLLQMNIIHLSFYP